MGLHGWSAKLQKDTEVQMYSLGTFLCKEQSPRWLSLVFSGLTYSEMCEQGSETRRQHISQPPPGLMTNSSAWAQVDICGHTTFYFSHSQTTMNESTNLFFPISISDIDILCPPDRQAPYRNSCVVRYDYNNNKHMFCIILYWNVKALH